MCDTAGSWRVVEIDQLRDDAEEATIRAEEAEESADAWHRKYEIIEDDMRKLKVTARHQADAKNLKLRDKLCIMIDLMEEYENMLDMYVHRTGVRLTTNNLKRILELKKKGELIT